MLYRTPRNETLQPETGPAKESRASRRRRGATALEYLFVISLILIVALTAIGSLGQATNESMRKTGDAIQKATNK
jgi:hypothetical protein